MLSCSINVGFSGVVSMSRANSPSGVGWTMGMVCRGHSDAKEGEKDWWKPITLLVGTKSELLRMQEPLFWTRPEMRANSRYTSPICWLNGSIWFDEWGPHLSFVCYTAQAAPEPVVPKQFPFNLDGAMSDYGFNSIQGNLSVPHAHWTVFRLQHPADKQVVVWQARLMS